MLTTFRNSGPPHRTLGTSGVWAIAEISPSVDPGVLGQVEPRDKVRSLGVAALAALREQGLAALHIARAVHADPSLVESERHRRAAQASAELVLVAIPAVERASAAYRKSIDDLNVMLAAPATELSDTRAAEIRSKLAGLPTDRRFAAVSRAIARGGDDSVAQAVLGSDRILTDDFLSDQEISAIRGFWRSERYPDEVARLKILERDFAHLERANNVMRSWQRACANQAIVAGGGVPVGGAVRGALGSPYGVAGTGGIEGAARRARGLA